MIYEAIMRVINPVEINFKGDNNSYCWINSKCCFNFNINE